MKAKLYHQIAVLALFLFLSVQPSPAFAQGSLAPPGPPAPTMKSLAQIEPRTAITNSGAVTISASGSYYLTTNISVSSGDAITISTNNVTLDLNGFTIFSTQPVATTNSAILLKGGRTNIAICNGHISSGVTDNGGTYSGSGFGNGIFYSTTVPNNVRVTGLSVSGCLNNGINIDFNSTVVEFCNVTTAGGYGIYARTISDSTAVDGGSGGMAGYSVNNCYGQSGGGFGIDAGSANNCMGNSTTGVGLGSSIANNCYATSSSNYGMDATVANNCFGSSSSGTGLTAVTANNCYALSSSSTALSATIATACYANSSTGTGLNTTIANGCIATSLVSTYHYNMPPSPQTP
jgi:hypothetical protein